MTGKSKQRLHGIAAPVLPDKPLFIRLCEAFVENLAMILRSALIVGALALAHQFATLTEGLSPSIAEIDSVPIPADVTAEPIVPPEPAQPVVTDRVRHYLNCTYQEYRRENYAECIDEPSGIYRPPEADPDDTGSLFRQSPLRFAYHASQPGLQDADRECREPFVCAALL